MGNSRPNFTGWILALALICSAAGGSAVASTIAEQSFDQMASKAGAIWLGQVKSITTEAGGPKGDGIFTVVNFSVDKVYKGSAQKTANLRFLGGTLGDRTLRVMDMPAFHPGERWIIFASDAKNTICPVLGWGQGRALVSAAADATVALPSPARRDDQPRYSLAYEQHRARDLRNLDRDISAGFGGDTLPLAEFEKILQRRISQAETK